ncbi:hypothetical protein DAEQUDRAFT_435115 [Daedalea quercina L-15889]|uniref:HRDC domain-containing protein n=1 Tax=Daedalea quercina L-15889 TaxID=1314783 RepID=A0A165ND84_9APHY|nr:hypothetical protein DAEQUDRAFT_435115 [Daedalea quercina L-15889]
MKFRAKPAVGTKRRKRASAAGEEQPPAAESSRKASKRNAPAPAPEEVMDLYQDDDVFDFGSPKKPTTRSQSRAAAIAVEIDEIEDADEEEEDPEQPYKLLDTLKDVRARVAEEQDIVDPVHIIADDDLFAIATLQPADNQSLQEALADADVSATFWAHAGEFLACYRQGSGVQTRFKPASAVSISSLHQQFTYQGRS